MTTDEKDVFIRMQYSIVISKALILVNCLNNFVHDCRLPERELVRKTVSVLSKKNRMGRRFDLQTRKSAKIFSVNATSRSKAMTFGSSRSL